MPRVNPQIALIVVLSTFVFVSFVLYNSVDSDASRREVLYNKNEQEFVKLKQKIHSLGKDVEENANVVDKLEHKLNEADNLKPVEIIPKNIGGGKVKIVHDALQKDNTPAVTFHQLVQPPQGIRICPSHEIVYSSDSSIQMLQAYDIIPFDNVDGGVWKQGWNIQYDSKKILEEKKLEVIVVPHSHCDPGWLDTFEGYFQAQTKNILDGMLNFLPKKPDMKFIYAEMSFFELWWSTLKADERRTVKKLLDQGQFEIVTGAWVMTDEANAHYYSTVMEMLEGHEFLINQLDYRPKNHWSIDPFGLSPILTYVAKAGNLSHAAVQRVHYSVKKFLAQKKNLEFKWRQLWAGKSDKTDIFTHMFPFYSYDVPHTCGPDPKVCCQFDFLRMFSSSCPWGVPPRQIDSKNVAQRASMLADQYRKKAQLYKTNVLLIPLGDDFRYSSDREWEAQHSNYIKLFEQMNSDTTLNIHARFGTLQDYFSILEKRQAESEEKDKLFETLSGDFFTYADRDDHYWSGYFTSRPFYKHMDRSLQHYLRSADISFSIANWKAQSSGKEWPGTKMYDSLVDARRAMSLFQHHDGVTGTAKDHVVIDYGEKMVAALNWSKLIIASAAEYLLKFPQTRDQGLKVDEEHTVDLLPTKSIVEDGGTVVIHNSLGYERSEVVCIYVSSFKSSIACDESESHIPQQIAPVLSVPSGSQRFVIDKDKFELCFVATIPPFGFIKYKVFEAESATSVAKVEASALMESSDFEAKIFSGSSLELSNEMVTAKFNARNGFLESYKLSDGSETPVEMSFVHYGARGHGKLKSGGDDLSGAYLFLPDGEAKPLSNAENSFVIVDGPIRKSVYIKGPKEILLTQCISLDFNNPSILIKNQVDIRSQGNFEAALRLKTGIIDGENFYTDLNGYQMIKRKRLEKLPLQAHFYPMPASAFIENDKQRLSLLGRQALGVASLQPGWMEVMLDRRLDQDDGRGLAQSVHDNHRTESVFRLLLEDMETKQNEDATIGYHSLAASIYSNQLHYPPTILFGQLDHAASSEVSSVFKGLEHSLPCDIHPVALRTLSLPTVYGETGTRATSPQNSAAFILHRLGIECRTKTKVTLTCEPVADNRVSLKSLFVDPLKNVRQASLTLLYVDEEKEVNDIEMTPMELKTVKLNF